ncbi:inclusion membrane protein A [Legionella beliardensis]|uniref:Inclusion membrane protein A n=1 Tax=Legionella beliardensis TaxID=91822 RepID=A0A378I1R2_9GAMM|nr:LegC2/C7 family Dot/Icm T4SS effector [Legionella beliardensis]STX28576.1 inclusion membrane protein A [Legionella beliardensis]
MKTKITQPAFAEKEENKRPEHEDDETKKENDKLQQILFTKKQLDQIKEELDKMVDALAQNTSILSRAAKFWGQLPWWQKVLSGSVITVPLFALTIITHLAVLLVISLFTLVSYVATSFLLDNHHKQSNNDRENLKKGILNLADTLGAIIESLDEIRKELANEIVKFQQENAQLNTHVKELGGQVDQLTLRVTSLAGIEEQLHLTQVELEQTSTSFADSVQRHSELLEKYKTQLAQAIKDYEDCQAQLSDKIIELKDVETQLKGQLDEANNVAVVLQGTVDMLSNTVITDDKDRLFFQNSLKEFLDNKKVSFEKIEAQVCEAKHQLMLTQEELRLSNERYDKLLNRAEGQLDRIERTFIPSPSPAATLKKVGLYASNEQIQSTKELAPMASFEIH